MIRITGNLPDLIVLAEETGSMQELHEKLDYLNHWGDHAEHYVNVHVIIWDVDLKKKDANIGVKFFKAPRLPEITMDDPSAHMVGGLNLHRKDTDSFGWSVNT